MVVFPVRVNRASSDGEPLIAALFQNLLGKVVQRDDGIHHDVL
jgi:hypothetical protein